MEPKLYLICNRIEALVASHLSAEEFGTYMAVGSRKNNYGWVMFVEVDPSVANTYPAAAEAIKRCEVHSDGQPRRSKYGAIYRVMEHIPVSAYGKLHLVTRDGRVLALEAQPYPGDQDSKGPRLYQELSPVTPMITSSLGPAGFIKFITDPKNLVSVPRILFADMLADREPDGRLAGYLPYTNPGHICDCLDDVAANPDKKMTKTVNRNPDMNGFFRTIRKGFFLGDAQEMKYYPYPSEDEMDDQHHTWWRSASL